MELTCYKIKDIQLAIETARKLKAKIKTGGHINCITGVTGEPNDIDEYEIVVYSDDIKQIVERILGKCEWITEPK